MGWEQQQKSLELWLIAIGIRTINDCRAVNQDPAQKATRKITKSDGHLRVSVWKFQQKGFCGVEIDS